MGGGLYNGQQYQQQVGQTRPGGVALRLSYDQGSKHHQDDQYGQPNHILEREKPLQPPSSRVIRRSVVEEEGEEEEEGSDRETV